MVKVVYFTYRGLFADNPRAIYEALARPRRPRSHATPGCARRRRSPAHLPAGVETVLYRTPEAAAVLGDADLVVANDCMSMQWTKKPGAIYLQTWHGTPLKRIHHDVARPRRAGSTSPTRTSPAGTRCSPRTRPARRGCAHAFRFTRARPRDRLPAQRRPELAGRATTSAPQVREELGIADGTTAVLYAPTWRDDLVFDSAGGPGLRAADRPRRLHRAARRRPRAARPAAQHGGRPARRSRRAPPVRRRRPTAPNPRSSTWPRICWSPTTRRRCSTSPSPASP